MARPEKQPHEKRDIRLSGLRLTVAEYLYIEEQAQTAGLSVSEYQRRRLLGFKVRPRISKIEQSLLVEMNRIGVNLNQIARAIHRGRDTPDHLEFLLHEFHTVLQKVGRSLG